MKKFVLLVIIASCVAGCGERIRYTRGYVIKNVQFSDIAPGKDTVDTVLKRFGVPTLNSVFAASDGSFWWYYIGGVVEESVLGEKVCTQQKIAIKFDKNNVVVTVGKLGDDVDVSVLDKQITVNGKTSGVMSEYFDGMGRYIKRFEKDKK